MTDDDNEVGRFVVMGVTRSRRTIIDDGVEEAFRVDGGDGGQGEEDDGDEDEVEEEVPVATFIHGEDDDFGDEGDDEEDDVGDIEDIEELQPAAVLATRVAALFIPFFHPRDPDPKHQTREDEVHDELDDDGDDRTRRHRRPDQDRYT